MWKWHCLKVFLLMGITGYTQINIGIEPSTCVRIPFELTTYNNMLVPVILNNKDTVKLMFHTAADAVNLTESATMRVTLDFQRTDSVKSWGGDQNTSRFSPVNTVQLGTMVFENVPIWEDTNSGQGSDGKFGINLFEGKTITFDFEAQELLISDDLPLDITTYSKQPLIRENGYLFIEAVAAINDEVVVNKYMIHSGYAGSVLFDDVFVEKRGIADKLTVIDQKELRDSFGNVLKTQRAVLPQFRIGNILLDEVPVGFFSGALSRQKISIIGGDILKRFQMVMDTKREFIYLKSNALINDIYKGV
ncbi:aspartyl protease family protein [Flavobacterium sp. NKUCC04_CG]|uniref:aspartyl protease family protein n=1 Tax=Flavobacterium sp. NKUCC04_CG TaxID=2842121 RepID=UPI001C5B787E|nr:aspartyl protease family protein [Flavobacterium sp. NKUCC04_CG]MBW3519183.1 aspartyl protease family protein [Flavobacterium sp. NKUCC04_CG]